MSTTIFAGQRLNGAGWRVYEINHHARRDTVRVLIVPARIAANADRFGAMRSLVLNPDTPITVTA